MASNTEKRDVIITLQGGQALSTIQDMQVAMRKLRKEFREAATEGKRKEVAAEMRKLNEELSKQYALTRAAGGAHKQLTQQMQSGFAKMTASARAAGGQILAALGITALVFQFVNGIRSAINTAKNFEAQMDKVRAVSRAADSEMVELEKSARNLGATTMFTATQVAELQEEYARLGFTVNEILRATPATLALAAATGESLADSAKIAGSTIRGFQMDASETGRVADVMALSFSKSALNLSDFGETMKYVAPIAKAANIDIETTTALMGKLADAGLRGTMAGTGLRNIISKLSDENSALSQELGFSVKNSEDLFRAFQELKKGNIDLTKATELTDERAKAAFITLVNGIDTVEDLKAALDDAAGSAQEMAETMQDNFEGAVTKMKSAWEGFVLTVTKTDSLRGATEWLTKIITGWTYILGGLEDNAALQESMASIAANFKEMRLDDLASGYRDMDDIIGEMATRMMEVNTQTRELSELEQRIARMKANGTYVPGMMRQELEERQKQLDLDRQYVRVLAEIRDEKSKADQSAATELAAEAQSIMAGLDKLSEEAAELEQERIKEVIDATKKLSQELRDVRISAINDVEAREIAAADEEFLRREEEINATKANEEVKKQLIAELWRQTEDKKIAISAEAFQKRLEQEIEATKQANDSELLTLELRVAVAEEGSFEQLDALQELLGKQMEIELAAANLTKEQKLLIKQDYERQKAEIEKQYRDEKEKEDKDLADLEIQRAKDTLSALSDAFTQLFDLIQQGYDNQIEQDNIRRDQAIQNLQTQFNQGKIDKEEFESEKNRINREYDAKERELKRESFAASKTAQIINATIQTAQAAIAAYSSAAAIPIAGIALGPIMAAAAAAFGAVQIGMIAGQPNPYYAGGRTSITDSEGNRHMAQNVGTLASGGYYSTPSYGVVAERGPELVIPNWLLNAPEFSNPIAEMEAAIARGYANGGRTTSTARGKKLYSSDNDVPEFTSSSSDTAIASTLNRIHSVLDNLQRNGVKAKGVWEWDDFNKGILLQEKIDGKNYFSSGNQRTPGKNV